MKILKRIAEEAYCFTEITFDSLEEYESKYPVFAESMRKMKKRLASTPMEVFEAELDETGDKVEEFRKKRKNGRIINLDK